MKSWFLMSVGLSIALLNGMDQENFTPLLANNRQEESHQSSLELPSTHPAVTLSNGEHKTEKERTLEEEIQVRKERFARFLASIPLFTQYPQLKESFANEGETLFGLAKERELTYKDFINEYSQLRNRVTQATSNVYIHLIKHKERLERQKLAGQFKEQDLQWHSVCLFPCSIL